MHNPNEPILTISNASFAYNSHSKLLFNNLSLEVKSGEVMSVLGPNGIGKTTLLKCIMRFLKLREGDIKIQGKSVKEMGEKEFWKEISYVPQAKKTVFGYTALNMVTLGLSQNLSLGRTPSKSDYDKALSLLKRFNIDNIADQSCNTLSGGQLQMVLICRALIKEPKILIMDEPESNLDMKNQLIVLNAIDELSKDEGLMILINTHYPDHALRCAQKTLMLGKDKYIFGETKEVVTKDNINKYFDIDAELVSYIHGDKNLQSIIPLDVVGI